MDTTAIAPAGAATAARPDRGLASLRSEDFFSLLISELKQQDPLEPSKTSDMIDQVAQIRSIELSGNLNESLAKLADQNGAASVAGLLGRHVTAVIKSGVGQETTVAGVVTGVRFGEDGTPVLELDSGQTVPLSAVRSVATLESVEAAAASGSTATDADKSATASKSTAAAQGRAAAASGAAPRQPWFSLGPLKLY
ncbi:MAG: hypothetical protein CHACPFDD_00992 [Phycisphaerae bacterium]|nr:hypothetical protein [Phycisphaerae bacterium]